MSIALKLEPRWPEPASFTADSALMRHMSARMRRAARWAVTPSPRGANSSTGRTADMHTNRTIIGPPDRRLRIARALRGSAPRQRRLAAADEQFGASCQSYGLIDVEPFVPFREERQDVDAGDRAGVARPSRIHAISRLAFCTYTSGSAWYWLLCQGCSVRPERQQRQQPVAAHDPHLAGMLPALLDRAQRVGARVGGERRPRASNRVRPVGTGSSAAGC